MTAQYTYNALNQRVRSTANSTITEYVFNANGQRASVWNGSNYLEIQGEYYWGSQPVAYHRSSAAHFQHQDWLGTERIRTTYNGNVEGTFTSLAFGDDQTTASGTDTDTYHYAMLDHDGETNTDHAQFRQYTNVQGRWFSPDPDGGSYDFSNPQSFNRYAYVQDNPLGSKDPSGQFMLPPATGAGCPICTGVVLGVDAFAYLGKLFGWWGGGPTFHGTLKPRPNAQPWDEYHIHYGPNIAGALGLPDESCEFGACGPSPFGPGDVASAAAPITLPGEWLMAALAFFKPVTNNAMHAPPQKVNSGVCSIYGNQPYGGVGLQCFCNNAGDSTWSQDTRGCLANDYGAGVPEVVGHVTCYAGSIYRTHKLPAWTLGKTYWGCRNWLK